MADDLSRMMNLFWLHIETHYVYIKYWLSRGKTKRPGWNLTDKNSVLVTHRKLPSVLVTHQNLLRCNNTPYLRSKRLYNHLVVCDYRELFRELYGQTTPLSSRLRGHRVKGTGIENLFQALFLARARRYSIRMIVQFRLTTR